MLAAGLSILTCTEDAAMPLLHQAYNNSLNTLDCRQDIPLHMYMRLQQEACL